MLSLSDIATAIEDVAPESTVFTADPKPKVDFLKEILDKSSERPSELASIDDIMLMSDDIVSFFQNLSTNMTVENIKRIESITHGQSSNEIWHRFRKGVVTASKCHDDVHTKMVKDNKGDTSINMWQLHQKITGLVFVNPNVPALKYGRVMEENAVNCLSDIMKSKHKKIHECGLYLDNNAPYIGGSPDRIITCSCCKPACVEIKCPYSINHLSPGDPQAKLTYLVKQDDIFLLSRSHQYYTQCLVQMTVTNMEHCYFMVWTPHGYIIDHLDFDRQKWYIIKHELVTYYQQYYLRTIFNH